MITEAELLERKRILLERLEQEPGPHEHDQIERLLVQIDTALQLLEEPTTDKARGTLWAHHIS